MLKLATGLMRSRFLLTALCGVAVFCLGMLSCGPAGYGLDVDVTGLTDDVVQLSVTATFGTQSANSVVSQRLDQFTLRLVFADPSYGAMQVTVSGIGADGCQRSVAKAEVALPVVGPLAVTLVPERGCKIVVRRTGDGQGEVKSSDDKLSCKFGSTLIPEQKPFDPLCKADVADACAFCLPLGSQVTLSATADQNSAPRAYFAGWTRACSGKVPCPVAVSAGSTEVGVGLSPTQVCSTDRFCWENPSPTGNYIYRVWGTSADDVWLVGDAGTILHWNGTFLAASPSVTNDTLVSVWGSGPSDVWAFGRGGTTLHYENGTWRRLPNIGNNPIYSIWGSGPKDIWAVGPYVIYHYDGTWTSVATAANLSRVWGSGPNDVWAVGITSPSGSVLHYDGTAWKVVGGLPSRGAVAVWGSGPNDIWAVGGKTALHYNGTWSEVEIPIPDNSFLLSLWGSGPKDIWTATDRGEIYHYDGNSWLLYRHSTGNLSGLWSSGPGDVWAVGFDILHLNGNFWVNQYYGFAVDSLRGVWGSGLSDVWAVGTGGYIIHYNGAAWLSSKIPVNSSLNGIWGSSANDVWAVGDNGIILHYNGTDWTPSPSQTTKTLTGVWGDRANNVWAVGLGSTILRHVGANASDNWMPEKTSSNVSQLTGVWGSDASHIWAVGSSVINRGIILRRSDSDWTTVYDGAADSLVGIWGSSSTNVWALSSSGVVLHWTGEEWQITTPLMGSSDLLSIWGNGTTDVWIAGQDSLFHKKAGDPFRSLQSGTISNDRALNYLNAGWSGGPGDAIVVGNNGIILHHSP